MGTFQKQLEMTGGDNAQDSRRSRNRAPLLIAIIGSVLVSGGICYSGYHLIRSIQTYSSSNITQYQNHIHQSLSGAGASLGISFMTLGGIKLCRKEEETTREPSS